MSAAVFIGVY